MTEARPLGVALAAMAASGPTIALAVGGTVAVAAGWLVVRLRGATVWTTMGAVLGVAGAVALLAGDVRAATRFSIGVAGGIGAGAGVALYLATAAFMAVAGRWPPLARHTGALYDQRQGVGLPLALALSVLLVAPGEELLWRGTVQPLLVGATGELLGGGLAWGAYVLANALSGSIPIVLAALVGGAAWTALAAWTGGVAAAIVCHGVWTGLMLVLPPAGGRR